MSAALTVVSVQANAQMQVSTSLGSWNNTMRRGFAANNRMR